MTVHWIEPDWPAPPRVRAACTLRMGGVSGGAYAGLNLGLHVGDEAEQVRENRRLLAAALRLPAEPVWLTQVHGAGAVQAETVAGSAAEADAGWTRAEGVVCTVMTADCLPILLCTRDGAGVAAVHAGWKGLAAGVVEAAVAALGTRDLLAWLGPAIGPEAFEVGEEVRAAYLRRNPEYAAGFRPADGDGRWLADICRLAAITLNGLGVGAVYGGGWCTWRDAENFYSYRRDRVTGRMATLIWREPKGQPGPQNF